MRRIDLDYSIEGHINARLVTGAGRGVVDLRNGVGEMEATFTQLAPHWDPRTIVLMCCDRVAFMSSKAVAGAVGMFEASGGYLSIGRHVVNSLRHATMTDVEGRVLVDVRASSLTDLRGDRPCDQSRLEGGTSHLCPGVNGVREIRRINGLMQQASPHLITLATSYEVLLEDGTVAYGHTYYPHWLPEPRVQLSRPQVWRLDHIAQEFDGRRLWVRTITSMAPLDETRDVPLTEMAHGSHAGTRA
jgi:hypothetical protein